MPVVPVVRVGAMLGPDGLAQRLNDFGLALPQPGGSSRSALTLGSADVTLLALTNAQRTLANGRLFTTVALPGRPAQRSTLSQAAAAAVFLVTDILADNTARARVVGLNSLLATRGFAAMKTGTSKDRRDNWCIDFTDRYSVGVWVGNASGEAMHGVSGISGAAPVWQALLKYLHEGRPSRPPPAPAGAGGVMRETVRFDAQREPVRDEWFIEGTESAEQLALLRASGPARQRSPQTPFASASPACATAASSRSTPTCRSPHSASPLKASPAPGCSTASGWAPRRAGGGRRGRGGTNSRCRAATTKCCRPCASRCVVPA